MPKHIRYLFDKSRQFPINHLCASNANHETASPADFTILWCVLSAQYGAVNNAGNLDLAFTFLTLFTAMSLPLASQWEKKWSGKYRNTELDDCKLDIQTNYMSELSPSHWSLYSDWPFTQSIIPTRHSSIFANGSLFWSS